MDRVVRVWTVGQAQELFQIPILKSEEARQVQGTLPRAMAFSGDGKTLAVVSEGNRMRLWETATGKERLNFRGNAGTVYPLVFSPDGSVLVSSSHDDVVRLWDPFTGTLRGGWLTRQRKINALAFAPSGAVLASGGDDRTVCLWDAVTGKELQRLEGHRGPVLALAFSRDGKKLVSIATDQSALIWNVAAAPSSPRTTVEPAAVHGLDAFWNDLASEDAMVAYRAGGALARLPLGQVTRFLQRRVKPIASPDPERLGRLIKDLDSPHFQAREKAGQELKQLGEVAESALRKALDGQSSPETRRRIEELLNALGKEKPAGDQLRALRTVEVLELMGTPRAAEVLEILARGAADARLTREARASLERLDQRSAGTR
jgi:hypothetical protein